MTRDIANSIQIQYLLDQINDLQRFDLNLREERRTLEPHAKRIAYEMMPRIQRRRDEADRTAGSAAAAVSKRRKQGRIASSSLDRLEIREMDSIEL